MIEVVAGILVKGNKILLAKRASHKSMPGKWEFPGGKIEKNEEPKKALERELFEEFGIVTKAKTHFKTTEHNYDTFNIKLISYIVELISGEFSLSDHDEIHWVEITKLSNYDVTDADKPIIELLKLKKVKCYENLRLL